MQKNSFIKIGAKELAIHGDYLRFKNDEEENTELIIYKITSVSIQKIGNLYSKLGWAFLGFFCALVSWYFLEESLLSNLLSLLSLIGGIVYFLSYFIVSNYQEMLIKSPRQEINIEFPITKTNKVNMFKRELLNRMKTFS